MSKRLLAGVCLILPLIACTSTAPKNLAAPAFKPASTAPAVGCVPLTATRLAPTPTECAEFGRTYSGQDVRSTGATDAASALGQLDPAIRIGH